MIFLTHLSFYTIPELTITININIDEHPTHRLMGNSKPLAGGLRGVWEGHPCPDTPAESGNYNIECVSPVLYTLRSAPIHRDSKLEREVWGHRDSIDIPLRWSGKLNKSTFRCSFISGRGDLAPTIVNTPQLRSDQMTEIIVITGSILAIMGIGVAIWSFIDTRKRYDEEYRRRKRRADD